MSKTIKLNDDTYHNLEELRQKKETYDEAVKRLIDIYRMLDDVAKAIPPGHYLHYATPPGSDKRGV